MLCVDFGTSFSKAFATIDNGDDRPELIDLPIGEGSGSARLVTPSELIIDAGQIFFGGRARQRLDETQQAADRLIDSIKQYVTLNQDVSVLGTARLDQIQDPTQALSQRDILVLYLGYLMYVAERALVTAGQTINAQRRFAHPAWPENTRQRNEDEMRRMMAEAVVLARSVKDGFEGGLSVIDARELLDKLKSLAADSLPLNLIREPVREATAAGAGALLSTAEGHREKYLIVDIGAGTTDVAGFHCVNNPNWDRSRVWEISGAAKARNMAGNVLDNAFQKFVLGKSSLTEGSEEYRQAGLAVRRSRRLLKEQLFREGSVIVLLPTDETVPVDLDEFLEYGPVVSFTNAIVAMVAEAADLVQGNDVSSIRLVATGGGATLPVITKIAEHGVDVGGRHIGFELSDAIAEGVRETNPDLVEAYSQIAVALGGALPNLPEQRANVRGAINAPPPRVIQTTYR
ncbi:hypothetical protein DK847_16630 [Aestuariivirga litoralis]|uniref:Hsp70 family protein n=2 Tax=Aestuariivirga litoralis TaxID=2650924 RepID=A0A2W2BR29_9HYPH|nr:hypothetical protein DK847_16630 [Aestuariivirga litoralis]